MSWNILESAGRKDFGVLENPGIWSLQVLESPGKKHFDVCTNPALGRHLVLMPFVQNTDAKHVHSFS